MTKRSAANSSAKRLELELQFKADIDENNICLSASLAYFFPILYVIITGQIASYIGAVLALTAAFLIYHFYIKRGQIKRNLDDALLK
jgi:positive regulator of sigma E activity